MDIGTRENIKIHLYNVNGFLCNSKNTSFHSAAYHRITYKHTVFHSNRNLIG